MITETIAQIRARLLAEMQADPVLYDPNNPNPLLRGLTSNSLVAKHRAMRNVMATEVFIHQMLLKTFQDENELAVADSYVYTKGWWQRKMLQFQYSATSPQVLQVITLTDEQEGEVVLRYPVIDTTLRLITRCAETSSDANAKKVTLRLAKGPDDALEKLTNTEMIAARGYVTALQPPGITMVCTTADPDRFFIDAKIIYSGEYSSTIQQAVKDAIIQYLKDTSSILTFGGYIVRTGNINNPGVVDYIQQVPGVLDVVINELAGRDYATAWADRNSFVQRYAMASGYAIPEDDTGHTLDDTLEFELGVPV